MTKTKLIVALCAAKHSGKDVCAEFLVRHRGFTHEKFATPLKQVCAQLFGFDDDQVHGDAKDVMDERWGKTPREILQFMGTEMFQHKLQECLPHLGRTFWAKALSERIQKSGADSIVISDMRFQHELECLQKLPQYRVLSIKIERPCLLREDPHPSECELEHIHPVKIVCNDGDVSTLLARVDSLCRDF